ncbi:MAG: glycerophosphodiester phosphodiesterase, partial [Acidobacteriota bacterium]
MDDTAGNSNHAQVRSRSHRALRSALLGAAAALLFAGGVARAFDLQGHRGARGLTPENTLPAFAVALSLGVTTLELDTAITRDGVIVVSHDPFLNRDITRGADGAFLNERGPPIHALNFAELQRYDVGRINPESRYAKQHPGQQPIDGTRVPRLAEVFALTRRAGNHDVRFNIETKVSPLTPDETLPAEAFTDRLLAMIYANGMSQRVSIQSFDWRTLQRAQLVAPEILTVYLTAQQSWLDNIAQGKPEGSAWTAGFQARDHGGSVARMIIAAGGRVWSPYFGDVDQAQLDEAHRLGLTVVVWTVNQPKDIERMLDLQVDGIISDRP